MSKFFIILFSLYFSTVNLFGEEASVSLTGGFLPYEAYYIQSIDLATGQSDVQLFDYLISSTDEIYPYETPIEFYIRFTIEIISPELGISEKTILLDVKTPKKVLMQNPVRLDNRDLNSTSAGILDITGNHIK